MLGQGYFRHASTALSTSPHRALPSFQTNRRLKNKTTAVAVSLQGRCQSTPKILCLVFDSMVAGRSSHHQNHKQQSSFEARHDFFLVTVYTLWCARHPTSLGLVQTYSMSCTVHSRGVAGAVRYTSSGLLAYTFDYVRVVVTTIPVTLNFRFLLTSFDITSSFKVAGRDS